MAVKIKEGAPYKAFAEKLTKLRADAGLSRAELGAKLGISGRSLINYESGERIPFGDVVAKMARFFGVSTDELLCVEDPEREMAKAETISDMDRIFGKRSGDDAQDFLDNTQAFLAGGTLSPEATIDFCDVMRQVLIEAEARAKEKFTPNRYRTPEWKDRTETQRAEADKAMRKIRNRMDERAALREEKGAEAAENDE